MKHGIALAGGGIRGFSQIGVLETIDRLKLKVDMISGTSIGSVIASLYAAGCSAAQILSFCLEVEERCLPRSVLSTPQEALLLPTGLLRRLHGILDSEVIERVVRGFFESLGSPTFQTLRIPLAIAAVDLVSGHLVLFVSDKSGFPEQEDVVLIDDAPIELAVRASCSFPMAFSPTPYKGMLLADGGLRLNVPAWPLRAMGADRVMASAMSGQRKTGKVDSSIAVGLRALYIMSDQISQSAAAPADDIFYANVGDIDVFDFGEGMESYLKGYAAAQKDQDLLMRVLSD